MSRTTNKFSLFDFCKKQAGKMEIYGEETLDEEGNITRCQKGWRDRLLSFYNRNDVEDYLYHNTRFELGSRTRHNFGSLFREEDGDVYIRLNLQIRFKK